MDIKQLETFYWIARLGSITEACKRLNATQSTLSMRLRTLENDLRVTLFDRAHKRLTLTAKGRNLLRYAEKILEIAEQVRVFVADPSAESGTVRVGAAELVALTWVPELIRRLSAEFPNVVLDLDVDLPVPLLESLSDGRLDLVLASSVTRPIMPFVGIPLGSVTFAWMASPALGLGNRPVAPAELVKQAVIGASPDQSQFYGPVQQWFAEGGASVQRFTICNSLSVSAEMVMMGVGVALLPVEHYAPLVREGKLEIVRTNKNFDFEYYAIRSALGDQALPKILAELASEVSTFTRSARSKARAPKSVERSRPG